MGKCRFGGRCYRKNIEHLREFHPEKIEKDDEKEFEEAPEEVKDTGRATKRKVEDVEEDSKRCKNDEDVDGSNGDLEVNQVHDEDESSSYTSPRVPFLPQPSFVHTLWKRANELNKEDPRDAFSSLVDIRLVGIFDFFMGDLDTATDDEIRVHARFLTDLPEMQTIMTTTTGRYALWRDEPNQKNPLVVYVKSNEEHFPKIQVIGDHILHAFLHAAGDKAKDVFDKFFPDPTYTVEELKASSTACVKKRSSKGIGRPFHGARIHVEVDANDVGYRSLNVDLNKLKRTLTTIGETEEDIVRKKKMMEIREINTNVQLANDECDFGMGLEFGHDLFVANYEPLDAMAKRSLAMAYMLLNRTEFGAIIEAHMASGIRRRQDIMFKKAE